jgi:hypothetical protein
MWSKIVGDLELIYSGIPVQEVFLEVDYYDGKWVVSVGHRHWDGEQYHFESCIPEITLAATTAVEALIAVEGMMPEIREEVYKLLDRKTRNFFQVLRGLKGKPVPEEYKIKNAWWSKQNYIDIQDGNKTIRLIVENGIVTGPPMNLEVYL